MAGDEPESISRSVLVRRGLLALIGTPFVSAVAGCQGTLTNVLPDSSTDAMPNLDASRDVLVDDGAPQDTAVDAPGDVERDSADDVGDGEAGMPDAMPDVGPPPRVFRSNLAAIGELLPANDDGLRLPPGFTSRVLARSGQTVPGTDYTWHYDPDGGAIFEREDGYIYVCNSESIGDQGGVSALRFGDDGRIRDAYSLLDGTNMNCSGGATPWGTWLSCEELSNGLVYECDPNGMRPAIVRPALGAFAHEAAAVHRPTGHIYLTEDVLDGRLYRYVPDALDARGAPMWTSGRLQAARVRDGVVDWLDIPDPSGTSASTRSQAPETTAFLGGEGLWIEGDLVFFSTKGDNKIWKLDLSDASLEVIYDFANSVPNPLSGVDAITASPAGDLFIAEDLGNMEIVALGADYVAKVILRIESHLSSEITGPAFDRTGTRLYFSSQRGESGGAGVTYEVTGPFVL